MQSALSQVFNLPTAACEQRSADYKSAIRQIKNLRYAKHMYRRDAGSRPVRARGLFCFNPSGLIQARIGLGRLVPARNNSRLETSGDKLSPPLLKSALLYPLRRFKVVDNSVAARYCPGVFLERMAQLKVEQFI